MKQTTAIQVDLTNFMTRFGRPRMGIFTGLTVLDRAFLGFQPGKFYVVGGVSSMGKSAILADFALAAAKEVPVGIMSIEMGIELLKERMIFAVADLNYHKANAGKLDHQEKEELKKAVEEVQKLQPIYIDEEACVFYPDWLLKRFENEQKEKPIDSVEYTIESWVAKGVKIIFLDYLQLADLAEKKERDDLKIKDMSRKLKLMSLHFKIPIIVLAQLRKDTEERGDHKPTVNDLWGSNFIRNDADVILLLYRPDFYKKKLEYSLFDNTVEDAIIILAKNRNGPLAELNVEFRPYCLSYRDKDSVNDSEDWKLSFEDGTKN